jgi:hypothetical protein
MHIKNSNYDFIVSLRLRKEPLYQTVDRIIKDYQRAVDEAVTMSDAFHKTFSEKIQLQQKLDKFMDNKDIPQQFIETSDR